MARNKLQLKIFCYVISLHTSQHTLTLVMMPMKVIPLRIPNQMPASAERQVFSNI